MDFSFFVLLLALIVSGGFAELLALFGLVL